MRYIDLHQVDTYLIPASGDGEASLHASPKWRSALEIIVAQEVQEFAQDKMFNHLIDDKWRRFGRSMYIWRTVVPYLLLLATFAASVMLRGADVERGRESASAGLRCRDFIVWIREGDGEHGGTEDSAGVRAVRLALEASLTLIWSPWLVWKGWRQRRLRYRYLDVNEDGSLSWRDVLHFLHKNMHFLLDIAAAIAQTTAGVALLCCWHKIHTEAMAVASIFLFCNLLNVLLPFKFIGVLLITIYKMLVGDITRFCLVFFILLLAFSIAMHLLLQRWPNAESDLSDLSLGELVTKLLWIALGDNLGDNGQLLTSSAESFTLALTLYVAWVVLSSVLMLNLIIAMMGKTFNDNEADTHSIWIFPFAALVLKYEKLLSKRLHEAFRSGTKVMRYPSLHHLTPFQLLFLLFFCHIKCNRNANPQRSSSALRLRSILFLPYPFVPSRKPLNLSRIRFVN
jgi:hypothetical protein